MLKNYEPADVDAICQCNLLMNKIYGAGSDPYAGLSDGRHYRAL